MMREGYWCFNIVNNMLYLYLTTASCISVD
nr:MAG TPA: hypothetical protein [Bacteriophage sp.]